MDRRRDLLHHNQKEAFIEWLIKREYVIVETKGFYEAIRFLDQEIKQIRRDIEFP